MRAGIQSIWSSADLALSFKALADYKPKYFQVKYTDVKINKRYILKELISLKAEKYQIIMVDYHLISLNSTKILKTGTYIGEFVFLYVVLYVYTHT